MAEKEINLNYETLFELFRREKTRQELQPLDSSFYKDFITYLKEKKQMLMEKKSSLDFSPDEVTKLAIQIENINKIIKELYERRKKKITAMALESSRTNADVNTDMMLSDEEKFYRELVAVLDKYKRCILVNLLELKMPCIVENEPKVISLDREKMVDSSFNSGLEAERKEEKRSEEKTNEETSSLAEFTKEGYKEEKQENVIPKTDEADETRQKLVRFLSPLPRFLGEELESYGPFEEEEIATLPATIADVLIKKAKAEEIDEEN